MKYNMTQGIRSTKKPDKSGGTHLTFRRKSVVKPDTATSALANPPEFMCPLGLGMGGRKFFTLPVFHPSILPDAKNQGRFPCPANKFIWFLSIDVL